MDGQKSATRTWTELHCVELLGYLYSLTFVGSEQELLWFAVLILQYDFR